MKEQIYGLRFIYIDGRERDTDITVQVPIKDFMYHEAVFNELMEELKSPIRIELFLKNL